MVNQMKADLDEGGLLLRCLKVVADWVDCIIAHHEMTEQQFFTN